VRYLEVLGDDLSSCLRTVRCNGPQSLLPPLQLRYTGVPERLYSAHLGRPGVGKVVAASETGR